VYLDLVNPCRLAKMPKEQIPNKELKYKLKARKSICRPRESCMDGAGV
jgi:hypothetical protein